MAIFKSVQITNDEKKPPIRGDFNKNGGALRLVVAQYRMTGNEVTDDVVQMANVSDGNLIHQHNSYLHWTSCGTTITANVGDGDDPNRYCQALGLETESVTEITRFDQRVGHGKHHELHEYTGPDTIDITLTNVDTPNTTGLIQMWVYHTRNG